MYPNCAAGGCDQPTKKPGGRGRPPLYCSDLCREQANPSLPPQICTAHGCDQPTKKGGRNGNLYCSDRCRERTADIGKKLRAYASGKRRPKVELAAIAAERIAARTLHLSQSLTKVCANPQCGADFICPPPLRPNRKYCSENCKRIVARGICGGRDFRECEICDTPFKPLSDRLGKGTLQRFCSHRCSGLGRDEEKSLQIARSSLLEILSRRRDCSDCGQPLLQSKSNGSTICRPCRVSRIEQKARRSIFTCKECGSPNQELRRRSFCGLACVRRYNKRISNGIRRARERNLPWESVDPIQVFKRDGWLCHLCGGKTLPSQRGSTHPKAPELDHIVPLAAGGHHTYANTACSHRVCNGRKRAQIGGQPSLFYDFMRQSRSP